MSTNTRVVVLGAGASRGVKYAHAGMSLSPLDSDFFDLLGRVKPVTAKLGDDISRLLSLVDRLPRERQKSMEKAFYTLHLRGVMGDVLPVDADAHDTESPNDLLRLFASCVESVLRHAHGKDTCEHHVALFSKLAAADTILSFNYDLVAERALRVHPGAGRGTFPLSVYRLPGAASPKVSNVPFLLKLHGSSNWKVASQTVGGGDMTVEVLTKKWASFDSQPGYSAHINKEAFPILLPLWDKKIEHEPWKSLWIAACEALIAAESLVIWGYSLPQTDIKAEQLFSLSCSRPDLNLCVIDPSPATRERWRDLLPKARYWAYAKISEFLAESPGWWPKKDADEELPF